MSKKISWAGIASLCLLAMLTGYLFYISWDATSRSQITYVSSTAICALLGLGIWGVAGNPSKTYKKRVLALYLLVPSSWLFLGYLTLICEDLDWLRSPLHMAPVPSEETREKLSKEKKALREKEREADTCVAGIEAEKAKLPDNTMLAHVGRNGEERMFVLPKSDSQFPGDGREMSLDEFAAERLSALQQKFAAEEVERILAIEEELTKLELRRQELGKKFQAQGTEINALIEEVRRQDAEFTKAYITLSWFVAIVWIAVCGTLAVFYFVE